MTILFDARPLVDPLAGGVTRVALGLLPALTKTLNEHKLLFVTTGSQKQTLPVAPHEHLLIPNKLWSLFCWLGFTSLDRAFNKHKPDFLFLTNLGFVGRPRVPYALVIHDISFLIEPRWFSLKSRLWHKAVHAKRLIKEASVLFAVSQRTKDDLIHHLNIPVEKVTVIPITPCHSPDVHRGNPSDPPSIESLHSSLANRRFVLVLGAADPRKNAACAITAVRELQKKSEFHDVVLVLVGADPGVRVGQTSGNGQTHGSAPTTIFLDHPSDAELSTLMRHASVFLYPSWYEGFGLPLHEAAAFGTPCIASTAGALPETAPQGTLFAPPAKPHLWVEALEKILTNPGQHRTSSTIRDWTEASELISSEINRLLRNSNVSKLSL